MDGTSEGVRTLYVGNGWRGGFGWLRMDSGGYGWMHQWEWVRTLCV